MALGWMTKARRHGRRSIPQQPRDLPWVRPAESISGSSPRRAAQRTRCIDGRGWSAS